MARRGTVVVILVLGVIGFASGALKLPDYIPRACKAKDPQFNACVLKAGQGAIPHIINGDRKYRVPVLDPLSISELKIEQGTQQVGLTLTLRNASMIGMRNVKFTNCNLDLKNRSAELFFRSPSIQIVGDYVAGGRVLLLPITGNGFGNITLSDLDVKFSYSYDFVKKADGKTYIDINRSKLDYGIKGLHIQLDNLFNGDKLLGDNLNRFLNENWRDVDKELGSGLADAIGEVFRLVLKNICDAVPYDVIIDLS